MNTSIVITKESATITSVPREIIPPTNKYGRGVISSQLSKDKNSRKTASRQIRKVCELFEMNMTSSSTFITFTIDKTRYPLECKDFPLISNRFKSLVRCINERLVPIQKSKYIKFTHVGKDQSFHLHVVFFNEIFASKENLERIWKLGNIEIISIKEYMIEKNIDNYELLAKYGLKAREDLMQLHYNMKKIYSPSNNLEKPIRTTSKEERELVECLKKQISKNEVLIKDRYNKNSILGTITSKTYKVSSYDNYFNFFTNGESFS